MTGHASYARQFSSVGFERVCFTNQYFNEQARMNARLNDVELVEQPRLAEMLGETAVTMLEVERVLFAQWGQS